MRTIKFRAWDVFYKKFVYSDQDMMSSFWLMVERGMTAGREVPIDRWTGLEDKNGHPIYEGDCVRSHNKHFASPDKITAVKYSGAGFILYDPQCCDACRSYGSGICPLDDQHETLEVVGNLYENPELLAAPAAPKNT